MNARQASVYQQILQKVGNPEAISQSTLRVGQQLVSAQGQYTFPIRKDVGNSLPTDEKLDVNDSFVMTDWGILLLAEDPAKPGTGVLQTYPNQTVFTTVANETDPNHLEAFYNGHLQILENNRVKVPRLYTSKCRVVRTTQQSAGTNKSEVLPGDGMVQAIPGITFNGSAKNELLLNIKSFPTQLVQHATAATRWYVVFMAEGFLVTGQSSVGALGK